jgi:hypothetical protein
MCHTFSHHTCKHQQHSYHQHNLLLHANYSVTLPLSLPLLLLLPLPLLLLLLLLLLLQGEDKMGRMLSGSLTQHYDAVMGSLPKGLTSDERLRIRQSAPMSPAVGSLQQLPQVRFRLPKVVAFCMFQVGSVLHGRQQQQ